jgi:hypothetical protein
MFYEQSCEYIAWPRYKHACRWAFVWGMLLGFLGVLGLAAYWFVYRSTAPKAFQGYEYVIILGTTSLSDLDRRGPHTVATWLEGLDYCQRLTYHQQPDKIVRYPNVVLIVPVLLMLGGGVVAVVVLTLASLGSLRFRQTPAQTRAPDIMT